MDWADLATVKQRLEMAARLVQSCLDILDGWRPQHAGEEIVRRDIELVARGVLASAIELAEHLTSVRVLLSAEQCPHCGWSKASTSVERCPRCAGPREVRDEIRLRDRRDAS